MQSLSSHQKPSKSLSKPLKNSSLIKIKKSAVTKKQPEEAVPKHIDVINKAKQRMQVDTWENEQSDQEEEAHQEDSQDEMESKTPLSVVNAFFQHIKSANLE